MGGRRWAVRAADFEVSRQMLGCQLGCSTKLLVMAQASQGATSCFVNGCRDVQRQTQVLSAVLYV